MTKILEDVKVVELSSWTFVPSAGVALADWGASVTKVEDHRGGDPVRSLVIQGLRPEDSRPKKHYMDQTANRGKRSIGLNLKNAEGYDLFMKMIKDADVFLTNWLPAPLDRIGLSDEELRAVNPTIIIARGTGQGRRGPDANRGGFDGTSYLARSGYSHSLTPKDSEFPLFQSPALGDLQAGITLAGGVLGALYHREHTGEATTVDVSLFGTGVWAMAPDIMVADFYGVDEAPKPAPGFAMNPVTNNYKTKDGRWLQLMFLQPDKFWAGFCIRIGLPELAEDERFVPSANLTVNRNEAVAILRAKFAEHDMEEWKTILDDEPGVWTPISKPGEVLKDPQAIENNYFIKNVAENGEEFISIATPIQFGEAATESAIAPEYGQHTEEIMLELGFDWPAIIAAKDAGVVM